MPDCVYVYSLINVPEQRSFGRIGMGGRGDEVFSVPHGDLAAVVSNAVCQSYEATHDNGLTHEAVNAAVIDAGFTPVPLSFASLCNDTDELHQFLETYYNDLLDTLRQVHGLLELGLRVSWQRQRMLSAALEENPRMLELAQDGSQEARIELGRLAVEVLDEKADALADDIHSVLEPLAVDTRLNEIVGEDMVLNAAYLVERERIPTFDAQVEQLTAEYADTLDFHYSGPWAPYNFVSIHLQATPAIAET